MIATGSHRSRAAHHCGVVLLFWGLAAAGARAELEAALRLEHASILRGESLSAELTIRNESDLPLALTGDPVTSNGEVSFVIRRGRDLPVTSRADQPLVERLTVLPGDRESVMINLGAAYYLGRVGNYTVYAEIAFDGRVARTGIVSLDVVEGVELAATTRALSGYPDRLRRYTLRYWPRDGRERLFLTVDEPEGRRVGVFDLGQLARMFTPSVEVDRTGRVRVYHQATPDRYVATILQSGPDEIALVDQRALNPDGTAYVPGASAPSVPGKTEARPGGRAWRWPWSRRR